MDNWSKIDTVKLDNLDRYIENGSHQWKMMDNSYLDDSPRINPMMGTSQFSPPSRLRLHKEISCRQFSTQQNFNKTSKATLQPHVVGYHMYHQTSKPWKKNASYHQWPQVKNPQIWIELDQIYSGRNFSQDFWELFHHVPYIETGWSAFQFFCRFHTKSLPWYYPLIIAITRILSH